MLTSLRRFFKKQREQNDYLRCFLSEFVGTMTLVVSLKGHGNTLYFNDKSGVRTQIHLIMKNGQFINLKSVLKNEFLLKFLDLGMSANVAFGMIQTDGSKKDGLDNVLVAFGAGFSVLIGVLASGGVSGKFQQIGLILCL